MKKSDSHESLQDSNLDNSYSAADLLKSSEGLPKSEGPGPGYLEVPVPVIPSPSLAPTPSGGLAQGASSQPLPVPCPLIKTNCGNDVKSEKFSDEDEYNFTIARFEKYIKDREDWYVKIHGKVKLTGTEFTYNKTDVHRWKDGYLKKRLARLYKLRRWFEMQPSQEVTMITLTVPHNVNKWGKRVRDGHNAYQAWENLKQGWDRIRTSRNGIFRGKDYVFFYEPHQSGYPHGHIMLFGEPLTYGEREQLHELWSEMTGADLLNGVNISKADEGRPIEHLIAYLVKYMEKTLYHTMSDWSRGEWLFNAIAHEKGYRLFTSSNDLAKIMKLNGEKDGTVECLEVSLEGLKPRISDDEVNSTRIWSNPDNQVNSPFLRQVDSVPVPARIAAWMTRTGETFRPEERIFAAGQKKWRDWERRRAEA